MATGVVRQSDGRFENLFFSSMAVLILVTVFLGFARTYYLAGVFKADPLPPLLHIHGAVFSSWIVLLIVQTSLVAAGRVDLHRRLGLLGFCLACLLVILGLLVGTNSMVRYFDVAEARHPNEAQSELHVPDCGYADLLDADLFRLPQSL